MDAHVRPESRLPEVGVSIFAVMTRMANEHGAINLSQGFPDFDCAPELAALAAAWMQRGHNQYAPMAGVPRLRQALARDYRAALRRPLRPRHRDHGHGRGHGGAVLGDHGPRPPGRRGRRLRTLLRLVRARRSGSRAACRCSSHCGTRTTAIDWDEVRRALTPAHAPRDRQHAAQPDGHGPHRGRCARISPVLEPTRRRGAQRRSVRAPRLRRRPAREPRAGARAGRAHGGDQFVREVVPHHRMEDRLRRRAGARSAPRSSASTSSSPLPSTRRSSTRTPSSSSGASISAKSTRFYQAKRDRFLSLTAASRFRPLPCRGTYFQLLDYSSLSADRDRDVAMRLLTQHGVASIPTSAFLYRSEAPPVLRFCFAKRDETLERAAARLCAV